MAGERARGPPLLARGYPGSAELAYWPGAGWAGIQEGGAQKSGPQHRLRRSTVPFLTEKSLAGKVRPSKPIVRYWVRNFQKHSGLPGQWDEFLM